MAGTSAGVGFAIPSSTVLKIVPQLIQYGKVCSLATLLCRLDTWFYCNIWIIKTPFAIYSPIRFCLYVLAFLLYASLSLVRISCVIHFRWFELV